mmetsp:Transcript_39707/g.54022  ORF Transcript_39707/g.54022 Transcript_39707/m.54022 type:complete len:451 (+) Transcript_39707:560-1912(+)
MGAGISGTRVAWTARCTGREIRATETQENATTTEITLRGKLGGGVTVQLHRRVTKHWRTTRTGQARESASGSQLQARKRGRTIGREGTGIGRMTVNHPGRMTGKMTGRMTGRMTGKTTGKTTERMTGGREAEAVKVATMVVETRLTKGGVGLQRALLARRAKFRMTRRPANQEIKRRRRRSLRNSLAVRRAKRRCGIAAATVQRIRRLRLPTEVTTAAAAEKAVGAAMTVAADDGVVAEEGRAAAAPSPRTRTIQKPSDQDVENLPVQGKGVNVKFHLVEGPAPVSHVAVQRKAAERAIKKTLAKGEAAEMVLSAAASKTPTPTPPERHLRGTEVSPTVKTKRHHHHPLSPPPRGRRRRRTRRRTVVAGRSVRKHRRRLLPYHHHRHSRLSQQERRSILPRNEAVSSPNAQTIRLETGVTEVWPLRVRLNAVAPHPRRRRRVRPVEGGAP